MEGKASSSAPKPWQPHPNVHKDHKNSINSGGDEGYPKTQTIRADDCATVSMNSLNFHKLLLTLFLVHQIQLCDGSH